MPRLSAVIITRNEEANIARCLDSVGIADEIIVIDSGSTDRTIEIATKKGASVYSVEWSGYGASKRGAVARASGDWILSLDADEVLTPELASEIQAAINSNSDYDGYFVRRKTNFLGKWIYHCGWYPDYLLRLFKRSKGNFDDKIVHEKVLLDGKTGYLNGEILHYSYNSVEQYFEKSNRYTTLGAEELFKRGKTAGLYQLTILPIASFIKHYFTKLGFLDGMAGFIISVLSAGAVFGKYVKLRELNNKKRWSNSGDDQNS